MLLSRHERTQAWRAVPILAFAVAAVNIVIFYNIVYSRLDAQGIPVGWDTPTYVAGLESIRNGEMFAFIQNQDGVNFLYYVLMSILPMSSMDIEIFVPIGLAVITIGAIGLFANVLTRSPLFTSASMLFASAWFGLYRITSDLHAQLLSIPFVFIALTLYATGKPGQSKIIVPLLLLASLVHFETTLLLSGIFLIGKMITEKSGRGRMRQLLLILPLLPGGMIYAIHLSNTYQTGVPIIVHEPAENSFISRSMGYLWPLVVAGVVGSLMILRSSMKQDQDSGRTFFVLFVLLWLLIALLVFYLDYLNPALRNYSVRAVVFMPIPLIASIPFLLVDRHYQPMVRKRKLFPIALSAMVIVGGTYANLNLLIQTELPVSNRLFMDGEVFARLEKLKSIGLADPPIFVYYPSGNSPGGVSEYYDNWLSALYGDHYNYLGYHDDLLNARETSFDDSVSRVISYRFVQKMIDDGVWNPSAISEKPIVVVQDFYKIVNIEASTKFDQVADGIYLYAPNKATTETTSFKITTHVSESLGWYSTTRAYDNIAHEMIETYVGNQDGRPYTFRVPLQSGSCYSIGIEYHDGSTGLGFQVSEESKELLTLYYGESATLRQATYIDCPSKNNVYFTFTPISRPGMEGRLFVSLVDAISVTKLEA